MTFTLCTAGAAVFSKVLPEQRFCVKVGDRPSVLVSIQLLQSVKINYLTENTNLETFQ
jgi:hypothetical protein